MIKLIDKEDWRWITFGDYCRIFENFSEYDRKIHSFGIIQQVIAENYFQK